MDFVLRFKNSLFLIAILVAQAIALAVQVRTPTDAAPDGRSVRLIRMWSTSAVVPVERFAHALDWGLHNGWSGYVDLRHVRGQNQDLQQQLTRMRIEQAALSEDAAQGIRLQALLDFKQRYVTSTIAAQVIGSSGSDLTHVLTIDKGSNDGLRPDMAVITPDGVVGKLRDVFPTTSEVLEINDQSSGAGVILSSTRIRAILRGSAAGRAQIGNLTADSRIQPGEPVITSGGDQVYPRGLPVGTVQSIAPDPERQPYTSIVVRPAVNLDRVEEVLVITATQSTLPDAAQQDLTSAESQHASDISAEKLPGIHDDSQSAAGASNPATPAQPAAPGAVPTLPVPHPLPTLHPDRYTTGEIPPASSLTPGAPANPQAPPPASQPSGSKPEAPK